MRILDRYVVGEMAGPFLFGVSTFSLLFLSVDTLLRAARMIVEEGNHISSGIMYVVANVPAVLAYAFPMSALLACLMAFGRLSADSEVIAMKAGGISFYRMALPGLGMTLVLSLVALYLTDRIVPEANYIAHNHLLKQVSKEEDKFLQNLKVQDVAPDGTDRQVIARRLKVDVGVLEAVTVLFYRKQPNHMTQLVRTMTAVEAVWTEDQGWVMHKVRTQDLDPSQRITSDTYSETMALPLGQAPQELARRPRARDEMNREQLLRKARLEQLAAGTTNRKVYSYMVEYHSRLALPFSCFIFGLFGIPLGLQPLRTSKSMGLGLSIVFIFIYYLLMTISRSLGENGVIAPFVASWLPNTVFGGIGLALLVKAGEV